LKREGDIILGGYPGLRLLRSLVRGQSGLKNSVATRSARTGSGLFVFWLRFRSVTAMLLRSNLAKSQKSSLRTATEFIKTLYSHVVPPGLPESAARGGRTLKTVENGWGFGGRQVPAMNRGVNGK
jgi:hypothetical protein